MGSQETCPFGAVSTFERKGGPRNEDRVPRPLKAGVNCLDGSATDLCFAKPLARGES